MERKLENMFKATKRGDAGIIGDPVGHSLSPLLQNTAFKTWWMSLKKHSGAPPVYHKFLVKPDELDGALRLAKEAGLRGLNVTVPNKVAACSLVDDLESFARRVNAVNTLLFTDGKIKGFNTDGHGFHRSLEQDLGFGPSPAKTALVLGAGGAGRVIVHRLREDGIRILWWNRNVGKLRRALEEGGFSGPDVAGVDGADQLSRGVKEADLVVNATSVGLSAKDGLPADNLPFRKGQYVFDVIYHRETMFMQQAKAAGAVVCGGLGMLVYQGARSFEIWTGAPAPKELMWAAIKKSV